jgi:hypothetical protein
MPANLIIQSFSRGGVSSPVILNQLCPKDSQQELSKMGLVVLEDTHLEHVPGTALLHRCRSEEEPPTEQR